ncbi:MAG: glycosyltransferase [Blautia sp.]|nr:glycosyltransferase [Blautia sp.]MCM1200946.1 glycosyltransferase [Bacteroides fragilis]
MVRYCFVILHYNAIEETEKCIESIQRMENQDEIAIVIVDNASPNGTGRQLAVKYGDEKTIYILLRESNDGFSRGNNDGCQYAVDKWNPSFLIVANNDVEFIQPDFTKRIEEEYQKSRFDILGPDIFNPETRIHQSPMSIEPPDKKRINKTIVLNWCMIALYPLMHPVMKKYFQKAESKGVETNYRNYQENICLMGACLIYAQKYIKVRRKIFEPETRFFYEENIQTLWCRRHGKKMVYQPELKVWHMEGRATETIANEKERMRFYMRNILEAAKIYRKVLERKN